MWNVCIIQIAMLIMLDTKEALCNPNNRIAVIVNMKILFIFFFLFFFTIIYAIAMDLLSDMSFLQAINNLKNPFWVISIPEILVILVLLIISLFSPVSNLIKNLYKKKSNN